MTFREVGPRDIENPLDDAAEQRTDVDPDGWSPSTTTTTARFDVLAWTGRTDDSGGG